MRNPLEPPLHRLIRGTVASMCTGDVPQLLHKRCSFDFPAWLFSSIAVKYNELLTVLWDRIDPTTLNRQGNDSGTQYRSG